MIWAPWQFLVVALAGWMNWHQQEVISYLREVRLMYAVAPRENAGVGRHCARQC